MPPGPFWPGRQNLPKKRMRCRLVPCGAGKQVCPAGSLVQALGYSDSHRNSSAGSRKITDFSGALGLHLFCPE